MEGDAAWDAAPSLNLGRAGNRQEFDSALLPPFDIRLKSNIAKYVKNNCWKALHVLHNLQDHESNQRQVLHR